MVRNWFKQGILKRWAMHFTAAKSDVSLILSFSLYRETMRDALSVFDSKVSVITEE